MEKGDAKDTLLCKQSLEENLGKHSNSTSLENKEKMTIRTKNGLVNGVSEQECKSNKETTTVVKSNVRVTGSKELKKNKKSNTAGVHNVELNNTHSSSSKKNNNQQSKKLEETNTRNCINTVAANQSMQVTSLTLKNNCNTDSRTCCEDNQLIQNQSKTNLNEAHITKTDSKRKKSKSKSAKAAQNSHQEPNDFNLPKFDVADILSATPTKDSLLAKISETPSSSHLDACKSSLLDYQDPSSEFEKDLIESIKNLKLQQESIKAEKQSAGHLEEPKKSVKDEEPQQEENFCDIKYVQYESELQMPLIMKIIQKDLSEPYSIYTYRYFIHNWPKLCFLAMCEEKCVGAIVCKLDFHRKSTKRGYIAMLAVDKDYRKRRIGSTLVRRAITEMITGGADEVVLETEVTNKPALRLYEQLGFVRDKRLFRYYLNGVDALRLKLWLR